MHFISLVFSFRRGIFPYLSYILVTELSLSDNLSCAKVIISCAGDVGYLSSRLLEINSFEPYHFFTIYVPRCFFFFLFFSFSYVFYYLLFGRYFLERGVQEGVVE